MTRKSIFLIIIPLILSAFTHLWNPAGFPIFHIDEGYYMEWITDILKSLNPIHYVVTQNYYFHPYLGPLFLAGILEVTGYPNSLNLSADAHSIEMAYFVPRVIMGILAVIDTFLIYKICERRYDKNVAFVSSILFAVMPITWLLRFIWLDNILLPFLLSSILFGVYTREGLRTTNNANKKNKIKGKCKLPLIILSGVLLGMTLFIKETAFIMIPLVGYLIFSNNRSWKLLGLWIVPIILIPLIWPASLLYSGHFDKWLDNIHFQTHRVSKPLFVSIISFFKIDPVLITLSFMGLALAALRKDIFVLLWAIPFFIFYLIINYVQSLHLIVLLPLLCISAGILVLDISNKIQKKYQQVIRHSLSDDSERSIVNFTIKKFLFNDFKSLSNLGLVIISVIAIFGLASTCMLVTLNLNFPYFKAVALITSYLPGTNSTAGHINDVVTVISRASDYIWIPENVFGKDKHVYQPYFWKNPIKTDRYLLVVTDEYKKLMSGDDERAKFLQLAFNNTTTKGTFERNSDYHDLSNYPYTSISDLQVLKSTGLAPGTRPGTVEIRTNYSPP